MPSNTPEPSDKLWICSLTCMIFWLNASLGTGKGSNITFADVYREIDRGTLFTFLERELGPMPTLSMLRPSGTHEQAALFAAAMRKMEGWEGNEDKILLSGHEHNGVCLVIGLIAELIQEGQWDIESLRMAEPGS